MKIACVILAAGLGKRMRSKLVKVLHPVCGEPMIYYPVALALQRGFDPVVVVVGTQAEAVRSFLSERFGKSVRLAVQDPPRGTGHAVASARRALAGHRGKLAIMYGDVPLVGGREISVLVRGGKAAAVAFLTGKLADPSGYGRVIRDGRDDPVRIVEDSDASPAERRVQEINTGFYLVDTPFVFATLDRLRRSNAQGEYYLTDIVEAARRAGLMVRGIERPDLSGMLGVNTRRELATAEALLNRRLVERLLSGGVTVVDPDRTCLGPNVRVGTDTVIHPGCYLRGRVRIGAGCRIGPGAVIRDAWIGRGAEVNAYSVLEGCRVGPGAVVGPFARLRPGADMGSGAHVGNFVEVKKSRLGRDSKANHLTYLGDATIGAHVNVGAGTITCNYDGVEKHPTVIDDGVFIGSDTQFVAPVRVGRNAVIGAGTTVTMDVPAGALAVSRVRQSNIEGYNRRKPTRRH